MNLLTYNGAQVTDPKIMEWEADHQNPQGLLAVAWFQRIKQNGSDVLELLHDGYLTACIGKYPFAYTGAFKAHVNLGFFHGVDLPDPHGLLEGTGKRMRHVKLKPASLPDEELLEALIHAAYVDIKQRIEKL